MKPKAPCLNCEDRHALCHSTCKKYLYFRHELNKINKEESKRRKTTADIYRIKKF